jgi:hypothetical protein
MSNTPDPSRKKTTPEDQIYEPLKKAAALWFQGLEWLLILGVMTYLAEQTQNVLLALVLIASYVVLAFYLIALFVTGIPFALFWIKTDWVKTLISIFISGILTTLVFILFRNLASEIQGKV